MRTQHSSFSEVAQDVVDPGEEDQLAFVAWERDAGWHRPGESPAYSGLREKA